MDAATFRLRVGQRLGIVPAAGSLSPEDGELIESTYKSLLAELSAHDMCWWSDEDHVTDEHQDVLIGMTAAMLVDEFGIPEPRRSSMVAQYGFGLPVPSMNERRLRRMLALVPADDGQQDNGPDYY